MPYQSLTSQNLDAFYQLVRTGSFSKAAESLLVTQSALSQRVQGLERELDCTLVIRDRGALKLTTSGQELFDYCKTRLILEEEVKQKIAKKTSSMSGTINIGCISSAARSLVLPAMTPLINLNHDISLEIQSREVRDLSHLLLRHEVDLIVTLEESKRADVENIHLGFERNIMIEAKLIKQPRRSFYLDHDADDQTTLHFLKFNKISSTDIKRIFLDDVYGIIDGVKLGWGRAVVPRHMIEGSKDISILKDYKPLLVPVYLQHLKRPYYSQIFNESVKAIKDSLKKSLE